ncbi:MAG: hypothetical protein ACTTJH_08405 [Bacteroidales bacterium]
MNRTIVKQFKDLIKYFNVWYKNILLYYVNEDTLTEFITWLTMKKEGSSKLLLLKSESLN